MNSVEIFNLDALEFMAKIPDKFVDLMITDPPYWTLDKWRNMGTTTRLGGNRDRGKQRYEMFFKTIDQDYLWEWFQEADRVLKDDGHLYIFCDDIVQPILSNWIREAGDEHSFENCHTLVWDKESMGMGYHYRRRYEFVLFAYRKKKRRLTDLGKPDVFRYKRVTGQYPTQKPAPLITELVMQSARIGDVICDPFAGSGVVGEATPIMHNCRILLNDNSSESMNWMLGHLKGKAMFLGVGDKVVFLGENDAIGASFQAANEVRA